MRFMRQLVILLVMAPMASGAENLIPNGDLDVLAAGVPAGWERVIGSTEELICASRPAVSSEAWSRWTASES